MLFLSSFLLTLFSSVFAWEDIVIPPLSGKVGDDVVLYYIQGANIATKEYTALATQVQKLASFPLWIAIPQMTDNVAAIPVPGIGGGVTRINKLLATAGMPPTAPVFYAGHSLGGAMVQDYVHDHAADAAGLILNGAFLARTYKSAVTPEGRPQFTFPMPVLTIGGELDGLCRLSRIAESYYSQITFDANPTTAAHTHPVTVIGGMCHGQFANNSNLPSFVTKNDITPEISTVDALYRVGQDIANFMMATLGKSSWANIETRVKESATLVAPLVDGFLMEGYWNFLPPCMCETPDEYGGLQYGTCLSFPNCTGGCRWTDTYGQAIMGGGLTGLTFDITDSFHFVTEEKPSCHLPHIHGNPDDTANPGNGKTPPLCDQPKGCNLMITTVTEAYYRTLDTTPDTGFNPVAAHELKTKMKSRQAIYNAAGVLDAQLNETDTPIVAGGIVDLCAEINQASLDWAFKHASVAAQGRYTTKGYPMTIGPDHTTCAAGPCWIQAELKYVDTGSAMQIESTVMVTPNSNPYPCGESSLLPCDAGFHYCKILSPARAMEWIYVDSLKPR
jgi:pimeloyl-ACP methyl ester carboxylesterase